VGIALLDADVPGLAAELAQEVLAARPGEVRREGEAAVGERVAQGREQLAAKQRAHDAHGQEVAMADGFPARGGKASAGDQAVDVGMETQRTAPGVERRDHAGAGGEVLGVCEQLEQRVADGREEEMTQQRSIGLPQGLELVGDGEDDVEVVAGQQLSRPGLEPAVDLDVGALRARAVPAGVVVDADRVAVGTGADVAPERGGAALLNGASRLVDVERQATRACVACEALLEDPLERDGHALSKGPRARSSLRQKQRTRKAPRAARSVQRMAAKLRPRVILPRHVLPKPPCTPEARGRQLQRLVGRRACRGDRTFA
jgi:hypothetical protein